jgi:hypothetical protein
VYNMRVVAAIPAQTTRGNNVAKVSTRQLKDRYLSSCSVLGKVTELTRRTDTVRSTSICTGVPNRAQVSEASCGSKISKWLSVEPIYGVRV